jgi:hypothetical protein
MEWSKAKTVFIILFAILNVFLFVSILYGSTSTGFNSDYVKSVKTLLESRNIRIEADVPSYRYKTGKIVYDESEPDVAKVVEFLFGHSLDPVNEPESSLAHWREDDKLLIAGNNAIEFTDDSPDGKLDISVKENVQKELERYLEGLGLNRRDYAMDAYIKRNGEVYVRYLKKFRGQLLFDVYVDFTIGEAGVKSIGMIHKNAVSTIWPEEILSAYQLMALGAIPNDSVITGISFGYKRLQEGELNDRPVWRIRFSDGHEEFYNAYNGDRVVDAEE